MSKGGLEVTLREDDRPWVFFREIEHPEDLCGQNFLDERLDWLSSEVIEECLVFTLISLSAEL
jgi:hypothetical protein